MEDITQYTRLDVARRDASGAHAWAMLFARLLLGSVTVWGAAWKIFHVGPFVSTRIVFVAPLAKSFVPVWVRWLLGFPYPFFELLAGLMILAGVQLRAGLLLLAATIVVAALGDLARAPLGDLPIALLPRTLLVLYLLSTPSVFDDWSVDAWLARRRRLSS